MDYYKESLKLHKAKKGKLEVKSKVKIKNRTDLSLAYTPGVAEPCRVIAKDKNKVYEYTAKANTVAVITDGSAVLGLGNIGAEASIPVMEGKAILFKEFAGIDAWPIALASQDVKKNIETIKNIAPMFGGINLEDIKAPECFEIENALQDLGIPVMHDDQHGTAIVTLAAIINGLKVVNKKIQDVKIILSGAGSAGMAIAKLFIAYGVNSKNIIMLDSKGALHKNRKDIKNNKAKIEIARISNGKNLIGGLREVIVDADIFIGVSKGGLLKAPMVRKMNKDSIVIAMANPIPEIMPDIAKSAGARIVATGRSDFPNQVNNVLAFPGVFRGALDIRARQITTSMKLEAAKALADCVSRPTADNIIPNPFNKRVVKCVANAVKKEWLRK
ncbi:NADP-dependent malic enzyme [Patescibacteria group bacterium]|nr:NADP-dependent malic enzyme [Patescibacteria group bacterium]